MTKAPSTSTQYDAVIKTVSSGDTLVLAHPNKPDVEKTVTLALIQAPRQARKSNKKDNDKQSKDEPFAFAAREFVRRKCVGKKVKFQILSKNQNSGRDYVVVYLNQENIATSLLKEGLAKLVNKESSGNALSREYEEAQKDAQAKEKGIWTKDEEVREKNIKQITQDANAEEMFKKYKGKPVNVVVDYVLTGSTVKVLFPDGEISVMQLSGVLSPGFTTAQKEKRKKERKNGGNEAAKTETTTSSPTTSTNPNEKIALPFAKEALHFTQSRVLQKDVTVIVEGAAQGTLQGTILKSNPKGDDKSASTLQEDLLSRGLAKTVTFNVGKSKFLGKFMECEQQAKAKKLGIWQDHQEAQSTLKSEDKQNLDARIIEVISGDSLRIRYADGTEERIGISNIKAQRWVAGKAEDFAVEARDLVKKKLAGKKISIRVDYRKTFKTKASSTKLVSGKQVKEEKEVEESRRFCTVLADGRNIGVDLVAAGYAVVIKGDERSNFYSQLIMALGEAKQHKRGIHSTKKHTPPTSLNDLTVKSFGHLQQFIVILKDKRTRATIEKCYSGSRFRLSLPKDYLMINFSLNGITSPSTRPLKETKKPKPFSVEALNYALDRALFKDVEIDIEDLDPKGNFVGQLHLPDGNYGMKLLKEGLARTTKSATKLKYFKELERIEKDAKKTKKGIWSVTEVFERKPRNQERKFKVSKDSQVFLVRVTAVSEEDPSHFFFQTPSASQQFATLESLVASLPDKSDPSEVKPNAMCLSKFGEEDPNYYRVIVKSVNADTKTATISFVDFGNVDTVPIASLRTGVTEEVKAVPALAEEGVLAFGEPHEEKYRTDALQNMRELTEGRDLKARKEYEEDNVKYYSLVDESGINVTEDLIRSGLFFAFRPQSSILQEDKNLQNAVQRMEKAQETAKSDRLGLWEDGDIYDDDEF